MKCKNCEFEQEKDFKFCPDCGLPSDDAKETPQEKRAKEAYEALQRIDKHITDEKTKREERIKEHEKRRTERKKRTATKRSRGDRFLNLF